MRAEYGWNTGEIRMEYRWNTGNKSVFRRNVEYGRNTLPKKYGIRVKYRRNTANKFVEYGKILQNTDGAGMRGPSY